MKYATFLYQIAGDELARVACAAEDFGFESLWIPEHLVLPASYCSRYPYSPSGKLPWRADQPIHDPLIALAYVARATTTIRLATGIFVLPLRNPVATARAVASLDLLSNGRFIFGIGIGWLEEEFAAVGMDFHNRARRTAEYLELMKALWTSDDPAYQGTTVSIEGVKFMPKPLHKPHPPIVLGGTTDASLRRAARLADGWYGIAASFEELEQMLGRLRSYEQRFDRRQPLEITVNPRFNEPLSRAAVKRLAALGVDRLIFSARRETEAALNEMRRLRREIMIDA